MNQRSLAISILERAREQLGQRLAERIVESQHEIQADAEGNSYLSEIETIYDELGARLAHVNAMLVNMPPTSSPSPADITASEIIYADLATSNPIRVDLEGNTLLALPAPSGFDRSSHGSTPAARLEEITSRAERGELEDAGRMISDLLDLKPSQAARAAAVLASRLRDQPSLGRRAVEAITLVDAIDENSAAELLAEMFELPSEESRSIVQSLRARRGKGSDAP